MRIRTIAIPLGVAVFAGLIYGGYWLLAADAFRDGFDAWAAERRTQGWTVAYSVLSAGGFPMRMALRLEDPAIGAPEAAGGWHWRGPAIVVSARPWDPTGVALDAPGKHRLVASQPGFVPVEIDARTANGAITRSLGGDKTGVFIRLGGVTVRPGAQRPHCKIDTAEARFVMPDRPGGDRPGPSLDLRLTGLDLGTPSVPELSSRIDRASLVATLTGPVVPGPRRRTLEIWRDGGGTVEISRLALRWQTLAINSDGTMALDRDLQPIAALRADIADYGLLINIMASQGAIAVTSAPALKFALDLVARATSGRPGRIAVPVAIQDRRLSLGPVPVMTMPEIIWR